MVEALVTVFSFLNIAVLLLGLVKTYSVKAQLAFTLYLTSIMAVEILSQFGDSNLLLLPISFFIHVAFLTYCLLSFFHHLNKWIIGALIAGMTIPMFFAIFTNTDINEYNSIERIIYNLTIIVLTIWALFQALMEKQSPSLSILLFLLSTLLFFSVDFIISLTLKYLIQEQVDLVGGIWFFRVFCLTVYYSSLLNLIWKKESIIFRQSS